MAIVGQKYRVGIASASYPYEIIWIRGGFNSYDDADEWAYDNVGLYRNVHIQKETEGQA